MPPRKQMPEPWPPDYLLFGAKTCTGPCGRTLPACTSHFVPDRTQADGMSHQCRDCRNAADKRRWPDRLEKRREKARA